MSVKVAAGQLRFYLVILSIVIVLTGCRTSAKTPSSTSSEPTKEQAPAVQTAEPMRIEKPVSPQVVTPPQLLPDQPKAAPAEVAPPTEAEIADVIARVYKDAVVLEKNSPMQFVAGDFNSDGSGDIAIVVKPSEDKLSEINSEVANWILESPKKIAAPVMTPVVRVSPSRSMPERVEKDEKLVAIIHGFGEKGWRNPAARQTYLLRNVGGEQLKQVSIKDFLKIVRDKDAIVKKSGDVISDSMDKETGFIYWNGSKYAWYH
jgi:hypothetical protein